MVYTVGEVAKKMRMAPSAIRYYDKEGLLPFVERSDGGIRVFHEDDLNWLFMIECLKKSGLSIKDIRAYIEMAQEGDATIEGRLQLFLRQREKLRAQMEELQQTLEVLDYKCWYYETAKQAGTTAVPDGMGVDEIPETLRAAKMRIRRRAE